MSGPNAARSLPPGDRDDARHPVDLAPQPGERVPGRKPELPTLLVLKQWMEQQQLALAELVLVEKQGNLALIEAATMRLAEAFMPNMLKVVHQLRKEVARAREAERVIETEKQVA